MKKMNSPGLDLVGYSIHENMGLLSLFANRAYFLCLYWAQKNSGTALQM
jgi:hypothetical protein